MFAFADTPSPAFSVRADWNETHVELKILAGMPVDVSDFPPHLQALAAQASYNADTPGVEQMSCGKCQRAVLLGPRQAIAYDLAPDEFSVLCPPCVALTHTAASVEIRQLGGG